MAKLGLTTNSQDGYLWSHGSDSAGMSLAPFSAHPIEGSVSPAEQVKVQLQLMKVLSWLWSVCAANKGTEYLCRVSRGGWGPHLIAHCYSHTFCEVTAVTPLAMAFPAVHEVRHRIMATGAVPMWKRTGHVGLWIRHSSNRAGLHKPSSVLLHVKLQTVLRQSKGALL